MSIVVRRAAIAALFTVPLFSVAAFAEEPPAQNAPVETPAAAVEPPVLTTPVETPAAASDIAPPVVVSATRFEASIETAPVNVTLITADDIAHSHAQNLAQALEQLGNVRVSNLFGINAAHANLDLAGFGATGAQNTLVLLNGRRVNEIDSTGANLATIPLDSIARIEIVRGSSSVLYGDNATAGIVNIVTKTGFDAPLASVQLSGGSFGARGLHASGRWAGTSDAVFISAGDAQADGYHDHNASRNSNLFSEYTHQGESATLGARISANRDTFEFPGPLVESLYRGDPSAAGPSSDNITRQNSGELFFRDENIAGELALRSKKSKFSGGYNADLRTVSFTPRWHDRTEDSELIVGLDAYRSSQDSNYGDLTHRSYAAYFSDTLNWIEKVAFNFGARYQALEINADSGGGDDKTNDHALAWDAAVVLKYAPGAKGYVRIARSFRFANIDEYSYVIDPLNPQNGRHLEAGLDAPLNDAVRIDLQIFNIALENEIAFDNNVREYGANVNLDDTRHNGVNFGVRVRVTPLWSTRFNYSYRDAQFTAGTYQGKTIPEIPQHKFALANTFDFGAFGTLVVDAYRTGERYFGNDFANAGEKMSSYNSVNLGYRYAHGPYTARVSVDNLLNKQAADIGYYVPGDPEPYSYYPLPERALHVAFDATF